MNSLINLLAKGYDPAERESQLNALQMQRNQLVQQPQDIAWQNQSRQLALQEKMADLARRPFKDYAEMLGTLIEAAPMINYDNLDQSREWFIRHDPSKTVGNMLPPKSYFETTGYKGKKGKEGYELFREENVPIATQTLKRIMAETGAVTARVNLLKALKTTEGTFIATRKEAEEERTKLEKENPDKKYKITQHEKGFSVDEAPESTKTPPSAGNAVDLAIKRKFGTEYLSDPKKVGEADRWLGTKEGIKAVQDARDDLTPPSYIFPATAEGIVPALSRGKGAGTVGEPTRLKSKLSAEQLGKVGELNAILQNINKTKELYGYGTGKEHIEWVGVIGGRKGGIKSKYLGTASGDQVKFYAYVKDMQDALLRARSGAQINEQEYARLVNFLPDPNLPSTTFKARLDRFEEATKILLNEKLSAFGQGYGTSGLGESAPIKEETKTINGKTYVKKNGKWYEK